ncbi:MAG: class I SAM-dependent methyltransferase [Caulobacteraceae bacterium]|nr:class I SAM-dependent methyltransferase [Caulobacteraceae bacterium]
MDHKKLEKYTRLALDTVYSEPELNNYHTQLIPRIVEQYFPAELRKDAEILDIGCGQGTFLDVIRDKGYLASVGVTLSPDDYEACISKKHKAVLSDMWDLPVQDNSIDYIWCRHAIEHSPYPLFALYDFNRVLIDGGAAFIEVPAPDCPRGHEYNPNHYSVLGLNMWVSLFRKTGFQVTKSDVFEIELIIEDKKVKDKSFIFEIVKHETVA